MKQPWLSLLVLATACAGPDEQRADPSGHDPAIHSGVDREFLVNTLDHHRTNLALAQALIASVPPPEREAITSISDDLGEEMVEISIALAVDDSIHTVEPDPVAAAGDSLPERLRASLIQEVRYLDSVSPLLVRAGVRDLAVRMRGSRIRALSALDSL